MWKHRSNREKGRRKGPGTRHLPWARDGLKERQQQWMRSINLYRAQDGEQRKVDREIFKDREEEKRSIGE